MMRDFYSGKMVQNITTSEKQTFDLARDYASRLQGGEVVALQGDLGAGKTVFVKGLAQGLGCQKNISSPTFVLMKVYGINSSSIKYFCHVDAYRINSEEDLLAIGLQDYLGREDTVTVLEWAEKITGIIPKKSQKIKIEYLSEFQRELFWQ